MNLQFEHSFISKGFQHIAGVDEAGRGPLAGPVFTAAVILPLDFDCKDLNDSKKLTEKKREELFEKITKATDNYAIMNLTAGIIDDIGILNATKRSMRQAVLKLNPKPSFVLLDGININLDGIPQLQIVAGDSKIASIAAASILAKVSRDRYMYKMHKKYPQYGFHKNKGYGTKDHIETIKKAGITPLHRKTFAPINKLSK